MLLIQMNDPKILRIDDHLTFWDRFWFAVPWFGQLLVYACVCFFVVCAGIYLLSLAKKNFQQVREAEHRERLRKEVE
jgi:hypothetical protein